MAPAAAFWVKSLETMYFDCVLAMYRTVLLVPGVAIFTEFEVIGLPFPNTPIWLYAEELQFGGWHIAVDRGRPRQSRGNAPVRAARDGGRRGGFVLERQAGECHVVRIDCCGRNGWVLFWFTITGFVVVPGAVRLMDTGGQVEKNPAELAAFATLAEIRTDPG